MRHLPPRLPRVGERIRDSRTGELLEVVGIQGMTGPGGGLFACCRPVDGARGAGRALQSLVPLRECKRLH